MRPYAQQSVKRIGEVKTSDRTRRPPATAINGLQYNYDFGLPWIAGSSILVILQTHSIAGEKISGFERKAFTRQNFPDSKVFGFKVLTSFRFWIQNLWRHDQTDMILFRISPLLCKRQNQSGTKTFRIHHESGTIFSSVNLVYECRSCFRGAVPEINIEKTRTYFAL